MPSPESIVALLGPTNTGKTHRAIERMLEHDTGIMGLPLRLLAREVYDRVAARVGERQVALVTGEEKRVPATPRYWISTVEAMPRDVDADFVAVDEVQLMASHERGHVFTDRVLSARGRRETWFMGAESARAVLGELVPGCVHRRCERLSTLQHDKPKSLRSLPKRSAIVAFSLPRVFELAKAMRMVRGGAAVVVGAMSPSCRNAQVAMYESGEVDFVVATDAIGMGLNLDIDHVAFADLRKFDGKEERPLDAAEIAQIAGRAGRFTKNGSFGVLSPLSGMPHEVARRVAAHSFRPLEGAFFRASRLDFSSIDALRLSLRQPAPVPSLRRARSPLDEQLLEHLAADDEIRRLADAPPRVELLWQVASIPDYRQLLFHEHAGRLREIFLTLARDGALDTAWVLRQLATVDASADDPETLLDRIADVRFWNYVTNQSRWVDSTSDLAARARELEDRLSDALHRAVVSRFVTRKLERSIPRAKSSSPFAVLADRLRPADEPPRSQSLVDTLLDAPAEALELSPEGRVLFGEQVVAKLVRGRDITSPDVLVTLDLPGGAKLQVQRRLVAWTRDRTADLLASLEDRQAPTATARGLLYQLRAGLGTAFRRPFSSERRALDPAIYPEALGEEELAFFERAGIVVGQFLAFSRPLLKPHAVAQRLVLARAFHAPTPAASRSSAKHHLPTGREVSVRVDPARATELYTSLGYPVIAGRAVRADIVERAAGLGDVAAIARLVGCPLREAERLATALGKDLEPAPLTSDGSGDP
jgi:ATP-dependent RNA helicase SUPV3L1/SUV3